MNRSKRCSFCDNEFEDPARFNNSEFCSPQCWKEMANMRRYTVSKEVYTELLKINNCQLCDRVFSKRADKHIDHCHTTGKIRGLLCRTCNVSLGGLGDTVESLKKAINYLERV